MTAEAEKRKEKPADTAAIKGPELLAFCTASLFTIPFLFRAMFDASCATHLKSLKLPKQEGRQRENVDDRDHEVENHATSMCRRWVEDTGGNLAGSRLKPNIWRAEDFHRFGGK